MHVVSDHGLYHAYLQQALLSFVLLLLFFILCLSFFFFFWFPLPAPEDGALLTSHSMQMANSELGSDFITGGACVCVLLLLLLFFVSVPYFVFGCWLFILAVKWFISVVFAFCFLLYSEINSAERVPSLCSVSFYFFHICSEVCAICLGSSLSLSEDYVVLLSRLAICLFPHNIFNRQIFFFAAMNNWHSGKHIVCLCAVCLLRWRSCSAGRGWSGESAGVHVWLGMLCACLWYEP